MVIVWNRVRYFSLSEGPSEVKFGARGEAEMSIAESEREQNFQPPHLNLFSYPVVLNSAESLSIIRNEYP